MNNIKIIPEENETMQTVDVLCHKHPITHYLHTQDGIKELNFIKEVDGKLVGMFMSYISTHIFYNQIMKN